MGGAILFSGFKITSAESKRLQNLSEQFAALRRAASAPPSRGQSAVLNAIFYGSRALTELLLKHPDWIESLEPEALKAPRRRQGLIRDARQIMEGSPETAFADLRVLKHREMLRIAARDLMRLGDASTITQEISDVADVCFEAVTELCCRRTVQKFGTPYSQDPTTSKWGPAAFCVFGMGKWGGQELNYSSDIDVLFVYSAEGSTFKGSPGPANARRGIANQQFFARLAEGIINECMRMTPEGFLYRVDLRLRPEGKTSPLARDLASYENYYAQSGQTWERMMLIKARRVAGDESLASEFLEMIQPFRYPRAISDQIPREVAAMKARIETEVVKAGELDRNMKLGKGGIREIEFLVQTLQLLHGGRNPFLQEAKTLKALKKLADYHLIEKEEAAQLMDAYSFLRDVEHRLQMDGNQQTHTIPVAVERRQHLAKLMGFATVAQFEKRLERHRSLVRTAYDKVIGSSREVTGGNLPREVGTQPEEWTRILVDRSFQNVAPSLKRVQDFVEGPGFGHRSERTIEHAIQLLEFFLNLCPQRGHPVKREIVLSDPDRVLARLDAYVSKYGARSTLYEAWVSNVSLFRLLLLAFDRSEFLAEVAIRDPDLIDEIEMSGQLRRLKSRDAILKDLRQGSREQDQHAWLRRYFRAEQMRIGLRDILGLGSPERTQWEITELADAVLSYGLEVVSRKHGLKKAPFAIVGLGKLGGRELIYGSDLDIVFVADSGERKVHLLQKYAVELLDLLSRRTENGATFITDSRLRPDGEKGLIVNTVAAYSDYYQRRAMLWEIQSLSRFRPITGNPEVTRKFHTVASAVTNFAQATVPIRAFTPDWRKEIYRMRLRIEKERTPAGQGRLAIKTGTGGLMDVEFMAQALCLQHGWHEPNTLAALDRAAVSKVLPPETASLLTENYRKLIHIERVLRRWSYEPESELPADADAFHRVAVRCGFETSEAFEEAVKNYRSAIRREFISYFEAERE